MPNSGAGMTADGEQLVIDLYPPVERDAEGLVVIPDDQSFSDWLRGLPEATPWTAER
jgi:hypothetical protein